MINRDFFATRLASLGNAKISTTLVSSASTQPLQVEYVSTIGAKRKMEDTDVSFTLDGNFDPKALGDAMSGSIEAIDKECKAAQLEDGACTITLALSPDGKAICANLGDSIAIAYVYNSATKRVTAHHLNTMHRPEEPDEFKRIQDSSGVLYLALVFKILDSSKIPADLIDKAHNLRTYIHTHLPHTVKCEM